MAVELAVLFISGLAVVWYLWLGGGVSARMALGCDIAVNLFAACALAVLIELLTLKRSTREEAAKILRNDDLAHYYISRFAKLYFEMTFADKAEFAAARKGLDFAQRAGVEHLQGRDVPVGALPNLFKPSDLIGCFYSRMLVEEFFDNETRLMDCFRRAVTAFDYEHFGELRDIMLAFVKASTDFTCSSEIRSTLRRKIGDRKMTDILSEWFVDGTFGRFRDAVTSQSQNGVGEPLMPYAVFCERIVHERDLLIAYEREMDKVRSCASGKSAVPLSRK
ncbi:MAG: hypothetical protein IJR99_15925 [Kiritimatiellae bacterium]|nr:hypothetical protein [Kiritimatiellia bacterium]